MTAAPQPWVRVGGYAVCLNETDELLLVHAAATSDDPGRWWLPGGGLEFGEDPEVGMLRELAEETGIGGTPEALAEAFSIVYPTTAERPGDPLHVVAIVYRVRPNASRLRNEADGSTDRWAGVARRDAEMLALSPIAQIGVRIAWLDG